MQARDSVLTISPAEGFACMVGTDHAGTPDTTNKSLMSVVYNGIFRHIWETTIKLFSVTEIDFLKENGFFPSNLKKNTCFYYICLNVFGLRLHGRYRPCRYPKKKTECFQRKHSLIFIQ
jgi:hypothetical protein